MGSQKALFVAGATPASRGRFAYPGRKTPDPHWAPYVGNSCGIHPAFMFHGYKLGHDHLTPPSIVDQPHDAIRACVFLNPNGTHTHQSPLSLSRGRASVARHGSSPEFPSANSQNTMQLHLPRFAPGTACRALAGLALGLALLPLPTLRASIAYGSINNFDTVNDTGIPCHGFEIEIEDCRSTDISYTFDYNHYGTPVIREDLVTTPGHPRTIIRWESKKNANGTWAAHTAVPTAPIAPTDGHAFTNPSVNFGGEHFGVGYTTPVGAIRYNWLVDDGAGNLVHGGAVQVSTPVFTYFPPVVALAVPAQVQAAIEAPPEPPELPVLEFGRALWVKEIRTESHNSMPVKLRDLMTDDPDDPDDKNWTNGEPDEVETEWFLLQRDLTKPDGGRQARLEAAPENLQAGDEIVTRRYEFFAYIGPIDEETGEAMASSVGPDGIHGVGLKAINGVEVDLANVSVVGGYKGAQMAAVDVDEGVGLIDHVNEGAENEAYTPRRLVVPGALPYEVTQTGALPSGMALDTDTGVLSGTPAEAGSFDFTLTANDGLNPPVQKNYTLLVASAAIPPPPSYLLDLATEPPGAGTVTGGGAYAAGASADINASANAGYYFVNWTDNGTVVAQTATHTLNIDVNHSLVAHFAPLPRLMLTSASGPAGLVLEWPADQPAFLLQESASLAPESWSLSIRPVTSNAGFNHVFIPHPTPPRLFFRLIKQP